jgi:hypothetical protein
MHKGGRAMLQFLLGLVAGFALGWWLDWYLNREESRALREEMAQKNATIAKLQKDLLSEPQPQAKPVKQAEPQPKVEVAEPAETVTAYCVKCRVNRPIKNPNRVTLSNGRPAIKGTCPVCSSGMFRMIKL